MLNQQHIQHVQKQKLDLVVGAILSVVYVLKFWTFHYFTISLSKLQSEFPKTIKKSFEFPF